MDFDSIEDFEQYANGKIAQCGDEYLKSIKRKAIEIVNDKIYGAYNPSVYSRQMALVEAFNIRKNSNGKGIELVLETKDDLHPQNDTWVGNKVYPLSEIILDYFKKDHTYKNGIHRNGYDVQADIEEYAFGEALNLLYSELKKSFDIL